jgi:hypothetical protein
MILKTRPFSHKEEHINTALGVSDEIMIQCRERIFFAHFSNALQSVELFPDIESAPAELTTVTGDLKRCLEMITDSIEYEVTLLNFMQYHSVAQRAFSHWKMENDSSYSAEDRLKNELMKIVMKLKKEHDKQKAQEEDEEEDDGINSDLHNVQNIVDRIDKVKASNYSFPKYMQAMGYTMQTPDVDDILKNLFDH